MMKVKKRKKKKGKFIKLTSYTTIRGRQGIILDLDSLDQCVQIRTNVTAECSSPNETSASHCLLQVRELFREESEKIVRVGGWEGLL